MDGKLEFYPDGTASIAWSAAELPVPLDKVLCLMQEVDLMGELVPFVKSAEVLHQFSWNDADRLIRIVSTPPIPFVSGLEATSQRFGFDLLDVDPWRGLCLVETGPEWTPAEGAPASSARYRELPPFPPWKKGLRQIDVQTVVALARPSGANGELTTIFFSGKGDIKVPRYMLPDSLLTWLIKHIGRFVFRQALDIVSKFGDSEHGRRLETSDFYPPLHSRIAEFLAAEVIRDNAQGEARDKSAEMESDGV